jgi:hypothetical protein
MNLYAIEKRDLSKKMMGVHCTQQSYVVAFRSHHLATHVAGNIHKMPRLVLNSNLKELTIYKQGHRAGHIFEVVEYKFDDLVIHPFKDCVGLVLPTHIVKEDYLHFKFETDVIQPCSEDVCALIKYGVRPLD